MNLHCFQLSLYLASYCFQKKSNSLDPDQDSKNISRDLDLRLFATDGILENINFQRQFRQQVEIVFMKHYALKH